MERVCLDIEEKLLTCWTCVWCVMFGNTTNEKKPEYPGNWKIFFSLLFCYVIVANNNTKRKKKIEQKTIAKDFFLHITPPLREWKKRWKCNDGGGGGQRLVTLAMLRWWWWEREKEKDTKGKKNWRNLFKLTWLDYFCFVLFCFPIIDLYV